MTRKNDKQKPGTAILIVLLLLAVLMVLYVPSTSWSLFAAVIVLLYSHLKK